MFLRVSSLINFGVSGKKNIALVMRAIGFETPNGNLERDAFWLLGRMSSGKAVGPEQAGIMFIAWRCLYAEIVHSRVDGTLMNIGRALNRVWQMTITRLRAEGEKWRKWHKINSGSGKKSYFPEKYQDRRVIRFNEDAEYTINSNIFRAYDISLRIIRGDKDGGTRDGSDAAHAAPQAHHTQHRSGAKRQTDGQGQDQQHEKRKRTNGKAAMWQPEPFRGTGPTTQTMMDQFMTKQTSN